MIFVDIHARGLGRINRANGGVYRRELVQVGGRICPHYDEVPQLMKDLVSWLQSKEFLSLHPIEQAALAQFQLVCLLYTTHSSPRDSFFYKILGLDTPIY